MSGFFSERLGGLCPYVPGEQPKDGTYIKLNTNENPYFPSHYAVDKIDAAFLRDLRLYSDPDCAELRDAIAEYYGVPSQCVMPTNGSDEALAFCFAAFGERGAVFPDVTYGFYKVFSELFGVNYAELPLRSDFTVDVDGYFESGRTVVLANPNAQTGIYLPLDEIERIVKRNADNVVIVDEAYIDFGGQSAVALTKKYDNLIVVQTFSKSRSLAGARVGFAVACKALIADMQRIRFSFNPYNVNRVSAAVATAAIKDKLYFDECVSKITSTRARLMRELGRLGYAVLPSLANFVLAKSPVTGGRRLYETLKAAGILVRHFADARISEFVRITVGTDEQTDALIKALKIAENMS